MSKPKAVNTDYGLLMVEQLGHKRWFAYSGASTVFVRAHGESKEEAVENAVRQLESLSLNRKSV